MRRRGLAHDLVVLGVATIVAVGAGELLLRVLWPQRSDVTLGMFEQDDAAGYRLRPSYANEIRVPEYRTAVRTDAEGHRVPEEGAPARPNAQRLLVLGDSFTFGVGVNAEDAFPEVLEGLMSERASGEWDVRNAGVGGYGPLRSAHALISREGAWRPEIVVHAIYLGNDLEDSDPATFRTSPVVRDGRMVTPGRHPLARARMFLRTRSHLYAFLRTHLYGVYRATGLWERSQYLDPVGLAQWPARIETTSWPAARDAIALIRDWSAEHGVSYLVVVIPPRWQVDDDAWRRYQRAWHLPEKSFDRDHAQHVVVEELSKMNVPTLNLLPTLRRAQLSGTRTYYRLDPHWTAAGHAIAAQTIRVKLQSLGWIAANGVSKRTLASGSANVHAG